jgi:hypothetical protein
MESKRIMSVLRKPGKIFAFLLRNSKLSHYIHDRPYVKLLYFFYTGEYLNLKNLRNFNQKLQWLKLYDRNEDYWRLVDKFEVRNYIKERIGSQYLIPLLGVWERVEDIDFTSLPNEFVLKCNHDSGSVIICWDKGLLDVLGVKKRLNHCMKTDYYWLFRDYQYRNIKPKIIAEKLMKSNDGSDLKDYKIHCFNGIPTYIAVDIDRFSNHIRNIYDTDWNLQIVSFGYPMNEKRSEKRPELLAEMLRIAEILSKGFFYLRVDLYLIANRIYFGELTFYTGGGIEYFFPKDMNRIWGDMIRLPN